MLSWLPKAWSFVKWLVGAERVVEPAVRELVEGATEPAGTPLPFHDLEHQRAQIAAATSHEVPPTPKPHPTDPSR